MAEKGIPPETAEHLYENVREDNFEEKVDGWRAVAFEEGDNRRWSQHCDVILTEDDETFWAFGVELGLTENQDNTFPWNNGWGSANVTVVELYQVWPITKTIIEYVHRKPAWLS